MHQKQHPTIDPEAIDRVFPRVETPSDRVPIWCLTPDLPRTQLRFFDTWPISLDGRYLAATRFRSERCLPSPGDEADIVLCDLTSGQSETVATTRAWDTQLGAQVQWLAATGELLINQIDTSDRERWRPYAIAMHPETRRCRPLPTTVYMAHPTQPLIATPCLKRIGRTQPGYGVHLSADQVPSNPVPPDDDGVWVSHAETGEARLVLSLKQVTETLGLPQVESYAFHVKWNPSGDRLMLVLRQKLGERFIPCLVTCDADGGDIALAMPAEIWGRGGHHPQWCPDGQTILMNLNDDQNTLRFVRFDAWGENFETLGMPALGSGHPSLHPDGRHILSDAYHREPMAHNGCVPLRWVDIDNGHEIELLRMKTRPAVADFALPGVNPLDGGIWRVDPHPVLDPAGNWITFNGCPQDERQIFLAQLSAWL